SGAGKMPAWLPVYPGAKVESHISGSGDDGATSAEGGVYTFTSADSPAKVMNYYQDQCRDLGIKVNLSTATAEVGRIAADDEAANRLLVVVIASASGGGSSGSVTFKRKR